MRSRVECNWPKICLFLANSTLFPSTLPPSPLNPNGPLGISRANNSLTTNLYVRLLFICIIFLVILVSLFSFYSKKFNTCVIIPTIPTLQLNILLKSHENNILENISLFHFGHFHTMRWYGAMVMRE